MKLGHFWILVKIWVQNKKVPQLCDCVCVEYGNRKIYLQRFHFWPQKCFDVFSFCRMVDCLSQKKKNALNPNIDNFFKCA